MSPTERLQSRPVDRVMRRHWISLSPSSAIDDAFQMMRIARVRQLPVVTDGILVGVLSYPRVVAARLAGIAMIVGQVMAGAGETAGPATTLREIAAHMQRAQVGCVLVVEPTLDGPRLVGIVTEVDLLRLAYGAASAGGRA